MTNISVYDLHQFFPLISFGFWLLFGDWLIYNDLFIKTKEKKLGTKVELLPIENIQISPFILQINKR